jgi:hypothetical protein
MVMLIAADWGSIPDWIGAIGTVGTLAAGVIILRDQITLLRAEAAQIRQAQAQSISAWTARADPSRDALVLVLRNGSAQPVYNLMVFALDASERTVLLRAMSPVPPGHHETLPITRALHASASGDLLELEFDDAQGRTWVRRRDGTLRELEASEERRWVTHAYPIIANRGRIS